MTPGRVFASAHNHDRRGQPVNNRSALLKIDNLDITAVFVVGIAPFGQVDVFLPKNFLQVAFSPSGISRSRAEPDVKQVCSEFIRHFLDPLGVSACIAYSVNLPGHCLVLSKCNNSYSKNSRIA